MNEKVKANIIGRMIPIPRNAEVADGEFLRLDEGFNITLRINNAAVSVISLIKDEALKYWSVTPSVTMSQAVKNIPAEGYDIEVSPNGIVIDASTETGVRYALSTLRQAAEPLRNLKKSNIFAMPQIRISDYPSMGFRGMHLCVFPETELPELEKLIRLSAFYKLNYIVIEPWGTFPYECEPDFVWPDGQISRDDFAFLRDLAKSLNVTMIPQINILGHASWSRSASAKHTVLNLHPEYAPLFEPDAWCWCLTNPETRKVLESLVCEIHEFFGSPEYFHLGCDEAYTLGSCSNCAEHDTSKLVSEHINYFCDVLRKRGAKSMIWHDMLIEKSKFPDYVSNGKPDAPELMNTLPKDLVICDWQYDNDLTKVDNIWASTKYFMDNGFQTLLCPWMNAPVTNSEGKYIGEHGGMGLLGTSWHTAKHFHLYPMFFNLACAAWNPEFKPIDGIGYFENFNAQIMYIDKDAGVDMYEYFGKVCHYQIDPDKSTP